MEFKKKLSVRKSLTGEIAVINFIVYLLTNAAFSRPSIDGQSSPRAEQIVASHAFKFLRKIVACLKKVCCCSLC